MRLTDPRLSIAFIIFFFCSLAVFSQDEEEPSASSDGGATDEAMVSAGESLFNGNCKTCHRIHQKLIGPALANVEERAPSIEWIKNFIWNSQKVIESGDEYAVNLYNEYNQTQMTAFPTFTEEEIMSILAYIRVETEKGPEQVAATATDEGAATSDASGEGAIPAKYLTIILIGLVVVLALILAVLVLIMGVLRRFLNQRADMEEGEAEMVNATWSLGDALRSKPAVFLVTFVFAAIAFKFVINGLFSVGVQKDYAPKQPIAFSHKLHAGQYEIDCQYCHTGVRKSKSANIPSPNICMNCHTSIKTESPEIQKIYAAIENDQPIEWVRVHNLPDLAYFNHAQHVQVGGLECQDCHGPIEEMEVVKQHSLLTMGWCIDCHRKTELNTKGNDYYTKLVELHEASDKEALKVEDIGGLECAKCHY